MGVPQEGTPVEGVPERAGPLLLASSACAPASAPQPGSGLGLALGRRSRLSPSGGDTPVNASHAAAGASAVDCARRGSDDAGQPALGGAHVLLMRGILWAVPERPAPPCCISLRGTLVWQGRAYLHRRPGSLGPEHMTPERWLHACLLPV